jgi:DNA polymerase-3 subunit delta
VKISAGRVDGFIAQPDPAIRAVLIYGPDSGLVRERALILSRGVVDDLNDPFRVAELSGAQINDSPARLADEILAMPFGGGQRLVIIRDAGDSLSAHLKPALDTANQAEAKALVVMAASNLSGRSSLRKLAESRDDCAALPCYPDDEEGRARLARTMLQGAGLKIQPPALQTLSGILGEDRQSNRSEIEKLILYADPDAEVTEDDVLASIGDSGATSLDETIFAAADGSVADLDRAIERFWSDGGEPVGLMRAAQRHFQRLHRVTGLLAAGESYDSAARRLRPPVFWKVAGRFQNQCRSWSLKGLEQAVSRLTEAELALKTTGTPGRAACGRTLLAIASMRRAQRR